MKKFYLTIEQRDRIVNDLLEQKHDLETELEKEKPSGKLRELAEMANQERDMLVSLLEVDESERP